MQRSSVMLLGAALIFISAGRLFAELPVLPRVPPTEPVDVGKSFRTLDGFHMDLLAAEPLVMDPVALEYDPDGRAYVVEMSDYPYTDKSTDKPNIERTTDLPLGRVRVLQDLDGDGRFDRSTIFARDLSWRTGLAFWKKGLLAFMLGPKS